MKKILSLFVLLAGFEYASFAGTGGANDDLLFTGVLLGFLLLLAGIFYSIDYLKRNGRTLLRNATYFLKDKLSLLKAYLNKSNSEFFDLSNY